ncbi:SDR family NAD(P)-dependent oxidoreductase [Pseudonocardia adelaidensis]|uniref:Short subunit dehydrogenase n=1 Tax=Pseudonocardia adelaidensis TaxID=648754 RepID=A0ABP9PAP1_9PSEU
MPSASPAPLADPSTDLQLHGTRAVVTGGSRGIGSATARRLAAAGARVVAVARTQVDDVRSS